MKLLVTGAAGWVGSHAVRAALARGWDVHAVVRPTSDLARLESVRPRIHLVTADLDDWPAVGAALADVRPDACLHAAWFAEPGKYLASPRNLESVMNTLALVKTCAANGCTRFVGVGSCFEYSQRFGYQSEDTPLETSSLYSAAKSSAATILGPIGAALGMKTTWARLFLQYGPEEDPRRLVPDVIRSLLAGKPVKTTLGEQVRDFLHIDDVAEALVAIVAADTSEVVNIGSGVPVRVRDVVTTIARQIGRPELVELGALPYRPGDAMFLCANTTRIKSETPWRPRFDLESGLADTIAWWRR
jgi:nucleoside-diphosphate-sugar epimerase